MDAWFENRAVVSGDTYQMIKRCTASLISRQRSSKDYFTLQLRILFEINGKQNSDTSVVSSTRELYWLGYDICHNPQRPFRALSPTGPHGELEWTNQIRHFVERKLQHRITMIFYPYASRSFRMEIFLDLNYNDICHCRKFDRYPN